MKVTYCDLCACPIKSVKFIVGIAEFKVDPYTQIREGTKEGTSSYDKPERYSEFEICDHCKQIIDAIFDHRFTNMCTTVESLRKQFSLPAIPNPKERKKGFRRNKK